MQKKEKIYWFILVVLMGVKNAPTEELVLVEGINNQLAEKIYDFFH